MPVYTYGAEIETYESQKKNAFARQTKVKQWLHESRDQNNRHQANKKIKLFTFQMPKGTNRRRI